MARRKSIECTISKGVPLPERSLYPFDRMAVGDCLHIPASQFETPREHWRVATAARYHGLRLDMRFTVRMMDDGVRVWRVA